MTEAAECSVWWIDASRGQDLLGLLTTAEQQRALSVRADGREAYVASRALTRALLASRFGEPPLSFTVVNTCRVCGSHEHGQPTLPGLDLSLSISHSAGRVGVALASRGSTDGDGNPAIGIDIEALTSRSKQETCRLVEVALTPAERRTWAALPRERREAAALAWWTRKESVLKAIGWGLSIAPDLLEVTGPTERPAVTQWAPAALEILGYELPVIHLYALQPGPGHVGFLASAGGAVSVTQHETDSLLCSALAAAEESGRLSGGLYRWRT